MVHCINKLIADSEQNLLMAKYAAGVNFDLLGDALEAVRRVGPGGHYLGDAFTLEHFQDAFFSPEILDYEAFELWQAKGSNDMPARTRKKAEQLLNEYQQPPLDAGRKEALDDFVTRRESEISPSLA